MEDTALYRPILKQAWHTTKKFKNLWFFGLFAAILGISGEYEIVLRTYYGRGNEPSIINALTSGFGQGIGGGASLGGMAQNLWLAFIGRPQVLIFILLIIIVTVAVVLFLVWLSVVSQIGLVSNVNLISKDKQPTINEGIDAAVKKFWPVAFVNAAIKLALFLLFVIFGWAVYLFIQWGAAGTLLYYIFFVIFIVVALTLSFLLRYQICYIVLREHKTAAALGSAWRLFKNNWLVTLEMAFVLFVIYFAAAIVTSFIIAVFLSIPYVVTLYYQWAFWISAIISLIGLILMIFLAFTITAVLNAFQWSAWTLLFNRLEDGGGESKIVRSAQQLTDFLANKSEKN